MSLLTDLTALQIRQGTLTDNKVANFAYNADAYDNDDADGVDEYDFANDNNIPVADPDVITTAQVVLDKGFRSQAASIARMLINHFFGRVSYNLNKVVDVVDSFITTVKENLGEANGIATLDENGKVPEEQLPASSDAVELTQAEYDALTEEEKMADVIYMITDDTETIADILIDDTTTAQNKTWSSEKVNDEVINASKRFPDYARGRLVTLYYNSWTATEDFYFTDTTISVNNADTPDYHTKINGVDVSSQDSSGLSDGTGRSVYIYTSSGYGKRGDVIFGSPRCKIYGLRA